jgi:hypothetical protein
MPAYIYSQSIDTLNFRAKFGYQKARFVSDHLNEAKRLEWRHTRWPKILRQAKQRKALLLFGDEASFAQWGSLSYTWAPKGQRKRSQGPVTHVRRHAALVF